MHFSTAFSSSLFGAKSSSYGIPDGESGVGRGLVFPEIFDFPLPITIAYVSDKPLWPKITELTFFPTFDILGISSYNF